MKIFYSKVYQNEAEIGEALAKVFGEGGVKREDIFITSKLWNTFHRADEVNKQDLFHMIS